MSIRTERAAGVGRLPNVRLRVSRDGLWLGAVIVAAVALRYVGLDAQSLWYDESFTASIVHLGWLHGLFAQIAHTESTPPLYYVLAKVWCSVLGYGQTTLRAFSAAVGVLVVLGAVVLGTEVAGRRAGLLAGTLAAVNPSLIWYSQEARSYELLILFATAGAWFFLRAGRLRRSSELTGWVICSALAMVTHYYAIFIVAAEALWLLGHARRDKARLRRVASFCVPLIAVVCGLAPLLVHQAHANNTAWIQSLPVDQRLGQLLTEWLTFSNGTVNAALSIRPGGGYAVVGMCGVALCLFGLARRGGGDRARWRPLGFVALIATLTPVALAFAHTGGFYERNLLGISILLVALLALGLLGLRWQFAALALTLLCGVSLITDIRITRDKSLQRPDWRAAAVELVPLTAPRVVVLNPGFQIAVLGYYDRNLTPLSTSATVSQLALIFNDADALALPSRVGAFRVVSRVQDGTVAIERLRAPVPTTVTTELLVGSGAAPRGSALFTDPAPPRATSR